MVNMVGAGLHREERLIVLPLLTPADQTS